MEAIVLCDGKFGAAAIQSAVDYLSVEKRYRVVGAALITPPGAAPLEIDVPTVAAPTAAAAIKAAVSLLRFQVVLDVTDGTAPEKLEWANEALRLGYEVHGADYRLWPPRPHPGPGVPSLAFGGAVPGCGKTAAVIHAARELSDKFRPVAVILNVGGPSYAEVVTLDGPLPIANRLLTLYREGRDVSGGHYQVAAAAAIPAVGCSFAGAGFTGVPVNSVLQDGAILAGDAGGDVLIFEGSGAAIAPCQKCGVGFVVPANIEIEALKVFPVCYHLNKADVIIPTAYGPGSPRETGEGIAALLKSFGVKAPVVPAVLEPEVTGEALPDDAVVVTARPARGREALKRFWEGRLKGRVVEVIPADVYPPRGDTAKAIRRSGESAGFILDLAAPNLGEWLEYALAWDMPVAPSFEVLKPQKAFVKTLMAKWETG